MSAVERSTKSRVESSREGWEVSKSSRRGVHKSGDELKCAGFTMCMYVCLERLKMGRIIKCQCDICLSIYLSACLSVYGQGTRTGTGTSIRSFRSGVKNTQATHVKLMISL